MTPMKTWNELRAEAWDALWRRRWFWRLFLAVVIFGIIGFAANQIMQGAVLHELFSDGGYIAQVHEALQAHQRPPMPPTGQIMRLVFGFALMYLVQFVIQGAGAFGLSGLYLRVARGEEVGPTWTRGLMDGFKRPLGVLALFFRLWLQLTLWWMLLLVPGIIAAYRYRAAWYFKVEHPDWSAGECIAASSKLMKGWKWKAFCFDCSYWKIIVAIMVPFLVVSCSLLMNTIQKVNGIVPAYGVTALLLFFAVVAGIILSVIFAQYSAVGRAAFYRDQKAIAEA